MEGVAERMLQELIPMVIYMRRKGQILVEEQDRLLQLHEYFRQAITTGLLSGLPDVVYRFDQARQASVESWEYGRRSIEYLPKSLGTSLQVAMQIFHLFCIDWIP